MNSDHRHKLHSNHRPGICLVYIDGELVGLRVHTLTNITLAFFLIIRGLGIFPLFSLEYAPA